MSIRKFFKGLSWGVPTYIYVNSAYQIARTEYAMSRHLGRSEAKSAITAAVAGGAWPVYVTGFIRELTDHSIEIEQLAGETIKK